MKGTVFIERHSEARLLKFYFDLLFTVSSNAMFGSVSKDTRGGDGRVMAVTMWLESTVYRCMAGGWDPPMYWMWMT